MVHTTIDLDPAVLRALEERAAREHKSLGVVASELLTAALSAPDAPDRSRPFRWRSASLGVPLVDLEDKEAVRRALN